MKRNVGSKVYGDKRWHIRYHIIRIMLIHFAHEDRLGTFQSSTCFMILREGSASQRKALSSSPCMESSKKARQWDLINFCPNLYHRRTMHYFG
jgi:hypothetical protein